MNTDNDTPQETPDDPSPCSADDMAAIALAARKRLKFIRWIARHLKNPAWHEMSEGGQDLIRAEVRLVLEQMVEGCS